MPAATADIQARLKEALALQQRGLLNEAGERYRHVLQTDPGNFGALHMLGVIAAQEGRPASAVELISRAIAIHAGNAAAFANRALALQTMRRHAAALQDLDRALSLQPNDAVTWYRRGIVLRQLLQHEAARESLERALTLRPDDAAAWQARGHVLRELRRERAALESYERALALQPDSPFLPGMRLQLKMRMCDWSGLEAELACLAGHIAAGRKVVPPFALMAMLDDPALHARAARIWADSLHPAPPVLPMLSPAPCHARHDKIRIGYFSADFHQHAMMYLMAGLFERHDRSRFELTAFSFGPDRQDAMRTRVVAACERFVDVRGLDDAEVAQLSRTLEIDIAVDLNGYTQESRPGIFHERAAPVQVSFLGYAGTTGASHMDYLLADQTVIPPADQAHYTEKIVYLPHSYQPTDDRRDIAARTWTRAELGLPADAFVFCCFNNNHKIVPDMFALWMRILRQVEGSVLWLLEDNAEVAHHLRREAALHDIDPRRLVFAVRIPHAEHLARHRAADLFLDTLPYNAHTTASDALWAGLPVLTCIGEAFPARVAASLLQAVGLPELVCRTREDYAALAIALAAAPSRLAAIRARLAAQRLTAPLFDTARFARHIEAAYAAMHERYHAGLAPASIHVPPE